MEIIIILLGILGLGTGSIVFSIRNLYYICQPSEVLIFAGSSSKIKGSRKVGYRLVKGGSSLRVPVLERAFRMDLTNMIIELKVTNAYSKGGIPLTVEAVANIKIAGEEPTIHNAIERLLGKTRKQIEQIAKETLEGNLRGVLASLTPEQVNEDKIAFAKSLLEEAEDDLEKLGLVLDTLQVQNISDDVSYLNSIGRKQQADLLRDARIAEAQAQAESVIQEAENNKKTSLRRIETQIAIAKAEADRRLKDALTKREALIAEAKAEIASEVARTEAEVGVQTERIKQVEQQLQADVVAPAEAESKRAIAQAKGNAAIIIEDGKAQAEGTRRLAESWKTAGPSAREIFLFQKLETLLKTMASTVPDVDVDNVTVIDTNNGSNVTKIVSFLEQLRQTTGVDLAETVRKIGNNQTQVIQPVEVITPDEQSWNRLRSDMQQFLDRLAEAKQTIPEAEKSVERAIKRSPSLRQRLQKAMNAGGKEALNAIFAHPVIHIPTTMVEAWLDQDV
ncbi:flotillin family protein [Oscillatoria salina]|uniref:flotillin family protein n=1 Tax=Oscillatoria salina TaxID=331517 RepID=UPI0013B97478|nr:SPFH domain-containing protein [Oscillatoria salina]MBZ8183252.1 flotillin family protein [Oscillatoria salina IIICB1]NET89943.1 flotillin family protein [Kamptonema sp. SIO1D9]